MRGRLGLLVVFAVVAWFGCAEPAFSEAAVPTQRDRARREQSSGCNYPITWRQWSGLCCYIQLTVPNNHQAKIERSYDHD